MKLSEVSPRFNCLEKNIKVITKKIFALAEHTTATAAAATTTWTGFTTPITFTSTCKVIIVAAKRKIYF